MTLLKNKKVLILGLGQYPKGSGVSAALYCAKKGAEVLVSDLKGPKELGTNVAALKKYAHVSFRLGEHRVHDIDWADIIFRNPRVRRSSPEMKRAHILGKHIESDISYFMSLCEAKIIGITGTRGKSTTSTLVYEMLRASGKKVWLGGNILISPLTFISKVKRQDVVVLELSSWLLETTGERGISPDIACITNVMRDHLNSYENMDEYAEAKAQIFRHQNEKGILILNARDAFCKKWAKEAPGLVKFFTKKQMPGMRYRGEHMQANIAAAIETAKAAGATNAGIKKALAQFTGLKDRQEVVAIKKGVTYINDTTASTPDGVIAAIKTFAPFSKNVHLIFGGNDKELEYGVVTKYIKKYHVYVALLPGTAHEKIVKEFKKLHVVYTDVVDMKSAFILHKKNAEKGDVILLSPGATSFGQFAHEFERGEKFRELVKKI